ncbi:MAG: fucose isomerase [Thermoprotei archaeon]|nr:MAG: fucose isomerase [Thermoprotei archaeon]
MEKSLSKIKVGTAFIVPPLGAIGGPPASEEWFGKIKNAVMEKLKAMYPEVEFTVYDIKESEDVKEFLVKEAGSIGYLVFVLNCITGLTKPILYSYKPTIMVAEAYGGSGEYLLEYSEARRAGVPVVGEVVRNVLDKKVLEKVKLFKAIYGLKNSRVLFIVSPSEKYLLKLEYPLSIDIYSAIKSVEAVTGVTPVILDAKEFVEKYYETISKDEAKPLADKWIREAEKNVETDINEIVKSAKLYLALKKAAMENKANAVAVDCIVLRNIDILDAWPCLGYMELWNDNIMPVCEADPYSAAIIIAGRYLTDRPGFIVDVALDSLRNEAIYYHCYAPLKPHGDKGATCPYIITPAHLGVKKASIHVKLPVGETVTAVGFLPDERVLTIHTAEIVDVEFSNYACSVKLIGKTNVRSIIENWIRRTGWHRVLFYGDWREEFKELATLLKLDVLEEDREMF